MFDDIPILGLDMRCQNVEWATRESDAVIYARWNDTVLYCTFKYLYLYVQIFSWCLCWYLYHRKLYQFRLVKRSSSKVTFCLMCCHFMSVFLKLTSFQDVQDESWELFLRFAPPNFFYLYNIKSHHVTCIFQSNIF